MRPTAEIWVLAVVAVSGGVAHSVSDTVPRTARIGAAVEAAPVLLSVPAAPVPVTAAGRVTLVYELHVANAGNRPLALERVEVRDAARADAPPIAAYGRSAVERDVKLIGPRGAPAPTKLTPGVRAVVYLWLTFDSSAAVPRTLTHRVAFADGTVADGAPVSVRPPAELTLAAPVGAGDWWIGLGPSNTSEHRRAAIRVGEDTVPHLAQRFAIDWVQMDTAGKYARDRRGRRNEDWYGYGAPVLAVADANVVAVVDGIPDNTPGEGSRAVAMKVATVLGNYVLLDLGPGQGTEHRYALYGHLKPGTLRVRVGDAVRRGQQLGVIGNSGNSDGPHLHFHVTEAADTATASLRAEGVPFLLDTFTVVAHDPERVAQHASLTTLGLHRAALPVEGDVLRIAAPNAAQPSPTRESPSPVIAQFMRFADIFGGRLFAAFKAIPAAQYEYRPTPSQQTIGYIAQHLENANYGLCERLGGAKRVMTFKDSLADTLKARWPKDTLVARLDASLRFCEAALQRLDKLDSPAVTSTLLGFETDLAEHYSQLAVYMRLLGLVPPSALPPQQHTAIELPTAALSQFAGVYELAPGWEFVVAVRDDALWIRFTSAGTDVRLWPESAADFFMKEMDAQVTFTRDARGAVAGLVLHQLGRDKSAAKIR